MKKKRQNLCGLPKRELRSRQMELLRHYLKNSVLPFSHHYRALFEKEGLTPDALQSWEDLQRIPFTSKADLIANGEAKSANHEGEDPLRDFVLIPDRAILSHRPSTICKALFRGRKAVSREFEREFRPIFMTSTTGRSAEPVPFLYSQHDIDILSLTAKRLMQVSGAEREFRLLNMFPFAPHLAFWTAHYAGTEFGAFMLSSGGGKVMGTDGNLRLVKKIQPDAFIGMPTFLYHVMHQAVSEGVTCANLKKLVLGGEKVPHGMRKKLRELARLMGAPEIDVLRTYAFTEAKMAWGECPPPAGKESSGYHLYPDLAIIELVDPKTGESVDEGPGEIVFTPLDARGSVVLRYRTGDIAEGGLTHEPCPFCGREVPRLLGPISRSSEVRELKLDKLKGTLVDFNQLEHLLDGNENVGTWQLELRKANDDPHEIDELILHVQQRGTMDEAALKNELNEQFVRQTEIHPNRIVLHTEKEISDLQGVGVELKEERIVDHRPKVSANRKTTAGTAAKADSVIEK